MSAMVPGGVPADDRDQLADEIVSYWEGETFVVQNGLGKLIIATDTLATVEQ